MAPIINSTVAYSSPAVKLWVVSFSQPTMTGFSAELMLPAALISAMPIAWAFELGA